MLLLLIIAQTAEAVKEATDILASKDSKWITMFLLVIGAIFAGVIFKWLFKSHLQQMESFATQLTQQRDKASEKDAALLLYLRQDRAEVILALQNNTAASKEQSASMRLLAQAMNRLAPNSTQTETH